jgi:acyl-CoA reductase-like NAD-dependent aldehyde dehydrogenase
VARFHLAGKEEIQKAIDSAMQARKEWESTPFEDK